MIMYAIRVHDRGLASRCGLSILLVSLCLTVLLQPAPASAANDRHPYGEPVRLHPELGESLSVVEAAYFGLYTDIAGLREVTFLEAPWGGYVARLRVETEAGSVWRERNVSTSRWRAWQTRAADILAGKIPPAGGVGSVTEMATGPSAEGEVQTAQPDSLTDRIRVWPEVPLPPTLGRAVPADSVVHSYQPLGGRWFVLLEAGLRHNVTDFNAFFTDMGMIGISWGRMFGRLMPYFSMEVGFGDLRDDFEDLAGDGRSNTYSFAFGLMARQPVSRRINFYGSGAFGYFIRSLQWQGIFFDSFRNTVSEGLVLEQQDWGWAFRAGFLIQRRHPTKGRFFDIGLGLQTTPAEEWHYFNDVSNFRASNRDMWVTLSVRIGDSI